MRRTYLFFALEQISSATLNTEAPVFTRPALPSLSLSLTLSHTHTHGLGSRARHARQTPDHTHTRKPATC